jgi:hypothetical protein
VTSRRESNRRVIGAVALGQERWAGALLPKNEPQSEAEPKEELSALKNRIAESLRMAGEDE